MRGMTTTTRSRGGAVDRGVLGAARPRAVRPARLPAGRRGAHGADQLRRRRPALLFRTASGNKLLAAALHSDVAFEIDWHDDLAAWSVVVRGALRRLHEDEAHRADVLPLQPWVPTPKYDVVELRPEAVTGRRFLLRGPSPTTSWSRRRETGGDSHVGHGAAQGPGRRGPRRTARPRCSTPWPRPGAAGAGSTSSTWRGRRWASCALDDVAWSTASSAWPASSARRPPRRVPGADRRAGARATSGSR